MEYTHFERLSALDTSFLELENGSSHMHIGAVAIFEGGPLLTTAGGVDIDRVRALMAAGIHRIPRYRQRLAHTPLLDQPVWIDDPSFNLAYHVRHTHLPKPGDDRQLRRLAGRLMSQELDRGKPLWEMWVVEGLEDDRFAIVTKAHHCMIDGVGSVELTGSVMRPTPDPDPALDEPPPPWLPRQAPSPMQLLAAELAHRAAAPLKAAAAVGRGLASPWKSLAAAREVASGIVEALGTGFTPASPTPLNVPTGPHRRFDWTSCDLAVLKDVRTRHGGTVNDVVLSVLAGALSRFFHHRGVDVGGIDFRVMVPVNVRTEATQRDFGNRVAMMVVQLPLAERDPLLRLERVVAETQRAKRSKQAAGMQSLEDLSDATFTTLFSDFARLTASLSRPYNLVVTNVPGPSFPVYVCGARMIACYPLVPLFSNQALGVAIFSYAGRLYFGFNADWDVLPDLHDLVDGVEREIGLLGAPAAQPQAVGAHA
jgi:diacylglycerol O-acyltransferase / wax synthase